MNWIGVIAVIRNYILNINNVFVFRIIIVVVIILSSLFYLPLSHNNYFHLGSLFMGQYNTSPKLS